MLARAQKALPMRPVEVLLRGLIDYAGLFPPASLDMSQAARNYGRYRGEPHSRALGRFVVPLSRLEEFAAHRDGIADTDLSIVTDAEQLSRSNGRVYEGSVFEAKVMDARAVVLVRNALPIQTIYVEVRDRQWTSGFFEAVAEANAGAKIRTGGINARDIPSPHDVVAFIAGCKRAKIPWKATAGLHHAFRGVYRLTYEPDSATALMHGFVNVFLAATLIYCDEDQLAAVDLLTDELPANFAFDNDGVAWRERRFTTEQIQATREQFAISFGSCSFVEPISGLQDLALL
jgi:hypothetical protein